MNTNPSDDDDDDDNDDDDDDRRLASELRYSADTQTGTLKGRLPITTFSEKKDSQLFCKRTNNNHKFKDCFLRGQVSLNGFQILNGCIVEFYWSVCKKLENLLFLENVVIGQSNSKNPGLSVCTVTNRFPNLLRVK